MQIGFSTPLSRVTTKSFGVLHLNPPSSSELWPPLVQLEVTEFNYYLQLDPLIAETGQMFNLESFGQGGLLSGQKTIVFVDNHDTQRSQDWRDADTEESEGFEKLIELILYIYIYYYTLLYYITPPRGVVTLARVRAHQQNRRQTLYDYVLSIWSLCAIRAHHRCFYGFSFLRSPPQVATEGRECSEADLQVREAASWLQPLSKTSNWSLHTYTRTWGAHAHPIKKLAVNCQLSPKMSYEEKLRPNTAGSSSSLASHSCRLVLVMGLALGLVYGISTIYI